MDLYKRYQPTETEPRIQALWQQLDLYRFDTNGVGAVMSIDTPPATVSGKLHLGHVYSYSQTDFLARFRRMQGQRVFYPMGYDDNGLPTERLVEKIIGARADRSDRQAFIARCLQVSEQVEREYRALWERLGLSVDWRHTYRTIDDNSRRLAQWSFLDLHRQNLVYRQEAPAIWCPECRTAIAQAEVDDMERERELFTLAFDLDEKDRLLIATTRPELLPGCVAIFVHPQDTRYQHLVGQQAEVPLFGQRVPILADQQADPEKGTGAVMCCTFGDQTDVAWWRACQLPLRAAIDREGRLTDLAGPYTGLTVDQARKEITAALQTGGQLRASQAGVQTVRIHERCDTPVEFVLTRQWFVRVLEFKTDLLEAGVRIRWHPEHMGARYRDWVQNLAWDWCISRQRTFGVPFPLWYCQSCGEAILAHEDLLPVDPVETEPSGDCSCGGRGFIPELDVMDTWATSSLTPQIVGGWQPDRQDRPGDLYGQVYPFRLRPQGHEIIRTWAFYTIVMSWHHFGQLPWTDVALSGWGLAPEGSGKISKSRGGGPMPPLEMIASYSADAVRYWAAGSGYGKDTRISEKQIRAGDRLVTKLWNVARFTAPLLARGQPRSLEAQLPAMTLSDRWILSRCQDRIQRITEAFEGFDHASARNLTEAFFWEDLADNYLEMAKGRLYDLENPARGAAQATLEEVLLTVLKLFAPFLPHVTEEIYLGVFKERDGHGSIHQCPWPEVEPRWLDSQVDAAGAVLLAIATAVRRFKSERKLSLATELSRLQIAPDESSLVELLQAARQDLLSVTRASQVEIVSSEKLEGSMITSLERVELAIHL